jgi:hypothetical protein
MNGINFRVRVESQGRFSGYDGLGLAHVLAMKQELTVQVRNINGVQIDLKTIQRTHYKKKSQSEALYKKTLPCLSTQEKLTTYHHDVNKAGSDEILEQLAADAAGTDHQQAARRGHIAVRQKG